MRRAICICLIALSILAWTAFARAQTVIGIVDDGPLSRPVVEIPRLENEIRGLVGAEFDIRMPDSKRLNGGWSLTGIREALRAQLQDPEVDIVITTGLIASNEAARIAKRTGQNPKDL